MSVRIASTGWLVLLWLCGMGIMLGGPGITWARTAVVIDLSGPKADDSARRLITQLAAMGIAMSPHRSAEAKDGERLPTLRGTIAQLQGVWALRLVLAGAHDQVLLRHSYPLRGPRLDPETVQQVAKAVATALNKHRGLRRPGNAKKPAPAALPVVSIPFERRGASIVVRATFRGPASSIAVNMAYDANVAFTTLSMSALQKLGVSPPSATMSLRTATGITKRPITVVQGIALEDAAVQGPLTVSECNACAGGGIEGVLGLNYSRHFSSTIDRKASRILLRRKHLSDAQTFDISPFLKLMGTRRDKRHGQAMLVFVLQNSSPIALNGITVSLRDGITASLRDDITASPRAGDAGSPRAGDKPPTTVITNLDPGAQAEVELASHAPLNASFTPTLRLVRARWAPPSARSESDPKKTSPPVISTESPIFIGKEAGARAPVHEPEEAEDDLGFVISKPSR